MGTCLTSPRSWTNTQEVRIVIASGLLNIVIDCFWDMLLCSEWHCVCPSEWDGQFSVHHRPGLYCTHVTVEQARGCSAPDPSELLLITRSIRTVIVARPFERKHTMQHNLLVLNL
jgi:hypothetical protein